MTVVIQNIFIMVMIFFCSVGVLQQQNIDKYLNKIIFSDHALVSHIGSRYNAQSITEEVKNYNNGKKSACDLVQIHLCLNHKGCYNPHAKIVCVKANEKESTILIISMKNFTNSGPIVVTGYKISNTRLMKQIINDRCFALDLTMLDHFFGFYERGFK